MVYIEPMATSLQDIANELDVSISTVSRSLSNHPSVNAETRAKVIELASRLGYRAARTNHRQVQSKHLQIGVLIQTDLNPRLAFGQSEFLAGMSAAAYELDVAMNVHTVPLADRERIVEPQHQPIALREGLVSGAILLHHYPHKTVEALAKQVPLLLIHNQYPGLELDVVGVSNARSTQKLVKHLHEFGHRRIGFVCWEDPTESWFQERLSGYMQALMQLGLPYDPSLVVPYRPASVENESNTDTVVRMIERGVTAWACANDTTGYALSQNLAARGITVGRDVALTGFDAEPTPEGCVPLTSMRENYREVGAEAVRRLVRRIRDPLTPQCEVRFPCELVVGGSTKPPS